MGLYKGRVSDGAEGSKNPGVDGDGANLQLVWSPCAWREEEEARGVAAWSKTSEESEVPRWWSPPLLASYIQRTTR